MLLGWLGDLAEAHTEAGRGLQDHGRVSPGGSLLNLPVLIYLKISTSHKKSQFIQTCTSSFHKSQKLQASTTIHYTTQMRGTHAHQNRNKGHTCFDKWSDNSSDTCQKEQVWPLQVRICQYSWKSWKPPTQLPNNVCKSQVVPLANSIIQPPETTKKRLYEVVRSFSKVVFWGPGPHNAMFNHYPTGSHSTMTYHILVTLRCTLTRQR